MLTTTQRIKEGLLSLFGKVPRRIGDARWEINEDIFRQGAHYFLANAFKECSTRMPGFYESGKVSDKGKEFLSSMLGAYFDANCGVRNELSWILTRINGSRYLGDAVLDFFDGERINLKVHPYNTRRQRVEDFVREEANK